MIPSLYPLLETIRDRLADIAGVTTCKIGLEQGIAHEDYPIIRVVPQDFTGSGGNNWDRRKANILIYFGSAVDESTDGLEAVYSTLLAMETQIVAACSIKGEGWRAKYTGTITDEDRLEVYKIMAVRIEVEG
jgi:hypothetical protein